MKLEKGDAETPDLKNIVERLKEFLATVDLKKIRYIVVHHQDPAEVVGQVGHDTSYTSGFFSSTQLCRRIGPSGLGGVDRALRAWVAWVIM